MRYAQLKQFDLNLLLSFQTLIEERSVSRAARRMHLSPSAMSRVFNRLRKMFQDELLVRTPEGYKVTDRALRAYSEIELLLPRLEGIVRAREFDPATAEDTFRIALPDSISTMKLPMLMKKFAQTAPGVRFQISILDDEVHGKLEANAIDLALYISRAPSPIRTDFLYEDEFVCMLRKGNPVGKPRLTIERYLSAKHVVVQHTGILVKSIQATLKRLGYRRDIQLTVSYSNPLGAIIEGTDLIATVAKSLALHLSRTSKFQIVPTPVEFPKFSYTQIWHPRYDSDPGHRWLRESVRSAFK
jgi:DNA-binding transcriptional LysR family regulator